MKFLKKLLKWFPWEKVHWGNGRIWLDCPILMSMFFVQPCFRQWRPLRIHFGRIRCGPYVLIMFGWLRREMMIDFIPGGVSSEDITDLKTQVKAELERQNETK